MDKNIFKNSGNSPILESKSLMENVRDNYLELTKPSTEGLGVVSPSFKDAMTKSEFLLKSASDIYYGAEDPRKEAKNAILGDILAEKYGVTQKNVYNTSTQEYFRKNVSSYIKSATGYDLDANSIWDIFVNKVEEGLSNTFNVAIPNIAYMIQTSSAKSDEERQFLREKYDKKIAEAYKNRRTDYFKEFDSVVDDLLMSTASFLPSVLPSLAVHGIGALLSAPTAGMSNVVSKIMASGWSTLTEGANAMLDMRMEGADEEVALTFGAIYGVIAGLIEAKVGDVIEDKMFGSLKRAGELFNKSGKFLEKDFVGRTATEIIKRRASEYVASFVTEPVEEMAQEFAQQLITELANKYQETYGEAFTDHKGINEMIEAVKDVGLETFKGNVLLGLGTNAISLGIDEMTDFKYARQAKGLAGNDFKVGENTDLNFTRNLRFNNKVKAVEVKEGEGIGSIRVRPLPDGSLFVLPEDAGKAKYATEKAGSKKNFGVYIDVIKDEDVTGDKMGNRETSRISSYQLSDFDDVYVEDNRIVVKDKDYSDAINSIIYGVGDSFNGMAEKNGIMNIKIGDRILEVARESEVGGQTYETLDESTKNLGGLEREIYLREQEKNKAYRDAVNSFKKYRKGDMITSYENALTQANAKNSPEIVKANMETAKRINESLFNTFKQVKGIKSDKKALAFANATTVFANRMANALNMTLEQFIGDVKFGEYSVTSEIEAGNIKADTVKEIIDSTSYVDTDNVTHILRGNINNSIIKISKAVDATTAIHEVSHLFLSKADIAKINGFNTIYADKLALDNEGNTDKSTWKVGKETQEAFATDFEKYVRENAVKDSALREVFEQLKMCLAGIRTSLAGELSDDTRKMLDELLGEDTVLDAMEIESGEYKSEDVNFNSEDIVSLNELEEQYNTLLTELKSNPKNWDGTNWLAPNGKVSNLTERQYVQVRTQQFKDWFGDWENEPEHASKIVDENGEPLVVYHGSKASFDVFKTNRGGGAHFGGNIFQSLDRLGLFHDLNLSREEALAEYGNDSRVRAFFLNIRNPVRFESDLGDWGDIIKEGDNMPWDGAIYPNKFEGLGEDELQEGENNLAYIAFHPNQIKSAVDNTGEFSINNNSILYSEDIEEANKALEGKISRNENGTVLLSEDVEYPSDFIVGLTDLFYALHGTGRDFDKFMDKYINSSTGIVHGWGHYFAVRGILAKMHAHQSKYTNETTADLYKIISDVKNTSSKIDTITEKLSKYVIDKDSVDTLNEIVKDDIKFNENNGIRTTRLDSIADDIAKLADNNLDDKTRLIEYLAEKKSNYASSIMELESDLIAIEGGEYEKIDNYNLFKVKVPAGKYLDWNKGISKGLVDELLVELKKDPKHFSHEIEQFKNWDEIDEDVHTFEKIYNYMAGGTSAKNVSKIFQNLGYKGIVYEDENVGGLCFVFFDEKFVNDNIVEHWKYKKLSEADNYYSEDIVETDAINRDKYVLDDAKYYKDKLKNGGRLSDMQMELVERTDAEGEEMIRVERTIPALFTTAPEVIDEARSAINKYLEEKSKSVEELTDEDWNKIADEWVKKLNKYDINRDDITGNIGFMVKKINAYTTLGMNESVLASWTSKFLGRNGNTEFKKFVKDFSNKTSYLGDVDYSNYNNIDNGQRFPFMTMMAYQLKNGMRVRQVVLDGAKKELLDDAKFFRNEWLIWNGKQEQADAEMEFDNEDSEYNEATRELHEFLYDATLSPRIRKIIKDETFSTDTVNKIIKTGEKIRKENSEKIRRLSDRIKSLQEENRQRLTKEESDKLKEEIRHLKEDRRELFNEIVALDNKNAFISMRLELEDIKKKINKIQRISAKGGNSDARTQSVLRFVYKALKDNGALYDNRNTKAKFEKFAPETFKTLSKLGIATEDGIEASLDTLTYNELNMLYKAMRDDSNSKRREREKIEESNKTENRNKGYEIVEDMRMEGVEITEEDNPAIEKIMKSHKVDREKAEKIFRQRKMLTKNPSGSVSDKERHMTLIDNALNLNFTIPYTWIGQISKQLRSVIFGLKDKFGKTHYGLNQYREKSLKMEQERFEIADTKLAEIFGINETDKQKRNKKVRKELAKFFDKYGTLPELTEEDEIKDVINTYLREDQREVALNLMKYQNVKNDSVYTKQNLIGIFIRTLNTNSLQHIVTSANNISMAQAMAVRKMFEENPEFEKMKEVAYALVDVVGKRFTEVAKVAYETENIDLVLEDYYYPNISSDKRINVVFKNNPLGKQVGEKTTNLTNFFVNERDNGQGQPVSLDVITDMDYNIKVQEEYIAGAKMFKDWDEMFNGEANVGGIIRAEYGDRVYNALMQFININKKRVNGELPQVDGLIGRLMSNYSLAKLAFNLSSVLQQPSSLFLALKDYSGLDVSKAFLRVAFGGRKYIEDNIYGKSEQMRHRSQLELGYAKELRNEASVYGKAVNAFAKGATFAMEKVDHFIADVLFDCAYQSELNKGLSESEASTNATQWVMNIQSSTDPKNNALAYSSKNSLMKLILMFTNQLNKQYNMVVSSILEDHGKSIIWTLEALALSTAWICLTTGKFLSPDSDDKDWLEWAKAIGIESLGMIPVIGGDVKGVFDGYYYNNNSSKMGLDVFSKLTQFGMILTEDDKGKKKQKLITAGKNAVYGLEDLIGAPSVFTKRVVQAIGMKNEGHNDFIEVISPLLGSDFMNYYKER